MPFAIEAGVTTYRGEHRWAEVRGLRRVEEHGESYVIGTFHDITARKQTEEQIRYQTSLLEETGRIAHVGGWWFDPATGEGLWTDEVARIHDLDPGAASTIGQGLSFYTGESRRRIDAAIKACIDHGTPYDLQLEIVTATQAHKWVRTIGHADVKDGKVVRIHGSFQDVTAHVMSERQRARAESQLRQAQKMEALGTLAGGIAHDFNNILAIIRGYAEMSASEAPEGSLLKEELQEVLAAADRAGDLVRRILTFSRQSEQEMKPTQVRLVVEEVLKMLRASIPSTIEIVPSLSNRAVVMADQTQIHQVLMNLCANAAHAMREGGGRLDVSTSDVFFASESDVPHPDLKPEAT